MAISASYGFNPQCSELVTSALQLAGVLTAGATATSADQSLGRQQLNLIMKALQNEGTILSTTERTTLSLSAGIAEYTLDPDTIDVIGDGTIVPASGAGETLVMQISLSEWMTRSDKSTSTQSRPIQFFVEKLVASTKVILCPTPDSSSPTFRYARVRLLRDMDSGSVTTDLPSRWLDALVWSLAHRIALAKSMPASHVAALSAEAKIAKAYAKQGEGRRPPAQFVVRHRGRTV